MRPHFLPELSQPVFPSCETVGDQITCENLTIPLYMNSTVGAVLMLIRLTFGVDSGKGSRKITQEIDSSRALGRNDGQ